MENREAVNRLIFLDGPGGTGKTLVERMCLAHVRARRGIALAVASSGVASLPLPGGCTAHSRFKIPVQIHADSTCSDSVQSNLATLLRETELIVWDEAVVQHSHCSVAVDQMLQDVRGDNSPFGRIVMLFAGEGLHSHTLCPLSDCQVISDNLYLWS